MDLSIFLAKVIGLYILIIVPLYFVRREHLKWVIDDYLNSPSSMYTAMIVALIVGLLIVVSHSVWVWGWPVLITLFGYLSLLKGIVWFYCPEVMRNLSEKMRNGKVYPLLGGVWLVFGVILTYYGFFA